MKKVLFKHALLIGLASALAAVFVYLVGILFSNEGFNNRIIKGEREQRSGVMFNFSKGEQSEIDFLASLSDKKTITLMGSSEFADDTISPYYYLPKHMNQPVLAIGHAYHQTLSILCELLAGQKYLNESKVSIIFSPGWIESGGTNIEAFLEFVRPDFLKMIYHNPNIPLKFKLRIGKFIDENYNLIDSPSMVFRQFRLLYLSNGVPVFSQICDVYGKKVKNIDFQIRDTFSRNTKRLELPNDYDAISEKLRLDFVNGIKSNSIYVNDVYYNTHLYADKVYREGHTGSVSLENNGEFEDFKLLLEIIEMYNIKASFIFQPFNPYYYKGTEDMGKTMDVVKGILDKKKIPYLDLYANGKKDYVPGTLADVMHFGTYGWTRINQFLMTTYEK